MTYSQPTGIFTLDSQEFHGYSGHGPGVNNPDMQAVHNVGPIPQGGYAIEPPHADEQVGPVAMRLVPDAGNEMFGRGDFLIHGPHANDHQDSSEGCIILLRSARVAIGTAVLASDNRLTVVA